jgi:hypothetical protein
MSAMQSRMSPAESAAVRPDDLEAELVVDDPATWPAIPCTECGFPAIRDGRHLCQPCLSEWEANPRPPRLRDRWDRS